ncbi:hypothetical protein [Thalassolituus sp.]|jgi:hypothetical protein|uniref:hypothetical protein n=1 Tax=Thalassolituus sp. TaxID=2030822 RepID=UPI0032D9939B
MTTYLKALSVFVVFLFVSAPVFARDYVFALTRQTSPSVVEDQVKQAVIFMTHQNPGDTATFLNADDLVQLGVFTIPNVEPFNDPRQLKARFAYNKALANRLMTFAKKAHPVDAPASSLPNVLRYIGENISRGKQVDVLILGSVLYHNPANPLLSMREGHFPSDSYLKAPRHLSPFSATDENAMSGMSVHIGFSDSAFLKGTPHDVYVKRFWQLFITRQGGTLNSWANDLSTLLRNIEENALALPAPSNFDGVTSDKLEIFYLRPAVISQSLFDRPVTTQPMSSHELARARDIEIGIRWHCTCDLDLHVRPSDATEVISFRNVKTAEGMLYKDYTDAASLSLNGFETVALNVPVDLNALTIAVNHYAGKWAKGIPFDIRISVSGQTYLAHYTLPAASGNGGADVTNVISSGYASRYTLLINPLSIIPVSS